MSEQDKSVYELLLEGALSDEREEVKRLTALLAVKDVDMADLARERDALTTSLQSAREELQKANDEINRWKRLYREDAEKPGEQK